MVIDDKRIRIITGHYGSGKTEFAINYAVKLNKMGMKTAISDLDIVNTYFRSREKAFELENIGIKVIYSSIKNGNYDIPAISPEIATPVKDKSYNYVIDLGGDDVGTVTLARLIPILDKSEVDFIMVVNTKRPETSTKEGIIYHKESLEKATGLNVTGFVNNTNLIRETTEETLKEGENILFEVSKETGIPVKYTSYIEDIIECKPENIETELFPMKFFMREEWM